MEQFLSTIEWVPVLVSFVLTFALGMAWYSPLMFVKPWMAGKGSVLVEHPMWKPMSAQLVSTFIFALIINIFMAYDNIFMSALVAITLAGFIKANGLFAGKTIMAVAIESGYIIVMAAIMIAVNMVL